MSRRCPLEKSRKRQWKSDLGGRGIVMSISSRTKAAGRHSGKSVKLAKVKANLMEMTYVHVAGVVCFSVTNA
jgi:hypothetical protein